MIQWTKDLSVGIDEIDDQHKEIFDRINKLLDACNHQKGKEAIGEVIQFLGNYVVEHFGNEERYMAKYRYPAYPEHKQQHEQFTKTFMELKHKFEDKGPGINLVVLTNRLVVSWLQNHIKNTDKQLGAFLKTKLI